MTTVGFVGLGAMGLPMAKNLVERQFRVQGFDLRREALDALAEAGGTPRPPPPRLRTAPTCCC